MSGPPLAADDPDRAALTKRRVLERLADLPRHYRALEAAMNGFEGRFDSERFAAAASSDDPAALNRVKAVERGVDQLFNYVAELSRLGLELAGIRQASDNSNARRDLGQLRDLGILDRRSCDELIAVAGVRNRMVHDYVGMAGSDVHEATRRLHSALPGFVSSYQAWLRADFPAQAATP